jgi:hypothetical protein
VDAIKDPMTSENRRYQLPPIMLAADVAHALNVSPATAAKYLATGMIPGARRIGRQWVVSCAVFLGAFDAEPPAECGDCSCNVAPGAGFETTGGFVVCERCASKLRTARRGRA